MNEELIRLSATIAWKRGENSLLLPQDEFLAVSSAALESFSPIDRHEHTMWVRQNLVFSRGEEARKKVHAAVIARLRQLFTEKKVTFCYAMRDADARRHLPDFLFAYHASRKCISYDIERFSDGPDSAVTIAFRSRRTLMNRLTNRLGREEDRLMFRLSSVQKLYGSSVDFFLDVAGAGCVYHFSFDGAHVCDEEELEAMKRAYEERPNKAPEPTTTAVTSPAAQEPRQP